MCIIFRQQQQQQHLFALCVTIYLIFYKLYINGVKVLAICDNQVSLCHANYTSYISWKTDHRSLVPLYLNVRSNY